MSAAHDQLPLSRAASPSLSPGSPAPVASGKAGTRRRPLVTEAVRPGEVLAFGTVLVAGSTCWLGLTVNWLSAALALFACLFYLLVYSLLLKRRSSQNVIWGGAAGCMPVLIGWTAVTGRLGIAPLALFGVVFFWTPPHTWALLFLREAYRLRRRVTSGITGAALRPMRLFHWSNAYLALLFLAVAASPLLR